MGTHVHQRASTRLHLVLFPAPELLSLYVARVIIGCPKGDDSAEKTLGNERSNLLGPWVEAVVKCHLSDHARPLMGLNDLVGLLVRDAERLVRVYVFAGVQRGDDLVPVQVVGCTHIDDIDVITFNQIHIIRCGKLVPEIVAKRFGLAQCAVAYTHKPCFKGKAIVKQWYVHVVVCVRLSHEPCTDDSNPIFLFRHV